MPRGTYLLTDPHSGAELGRETFSCGAGPSGWRYVGQLWPAGTRPHAGTPYGTVDLVTDASWRLLRLEIRRGGWTVRAGSLGREVGWVRHPGGEESREVGAGFTGPSPAFLVAVARLLDLPVGGRTRLRLMTLSDVLGVLPVHQGWTCTTIDAHETDLGPLHVETYQVVDLDAGTTGTLHLGGDVVLAADGVELEQLDGPPTLRRAAPSEAQDGGANAFPAGGSGA